MLEKNENILYFDAHFHLADCIRDSRVKHGNDTTDTLSLSGLTRQSNDIEWYACTCSHSQEEWELTERFRNKFGMTGERLFVSCGLHPQSAGHIDVQACADFLEQLLQQNKLDAIGEAGFDYFNDEFKSVAATQEQMFNIQLELAIKYNLPLVIHCRKANEKLFEYSKQLKKVRAVLFHSFMGMPNEAKSLLDRGINGFFSFGKQVMNNNKKVIACVQQLAPEVLLTETDAPWQFLKGEKATIPCDIKKIFQAFCEIKNVTPGQLEPILKDNFLRLFSSKQ